MQRRGYDWHPPARDSRGGSSWRESSYRGRRRRDSSPYQRHEPYRGPPDSYSSPSVRSDSRPFLSHRGPPSRPRLSSDTYGPSRDSYHPPGPPSRRPPPLGDRLQNRPPFSEPRGFHRPSFPRRSGWRGGRGDHNVPVANGFGVRDFRSPSSSSSQVIPRKRAWSVVEDDSNPVEEDDRRRAPSPSRDNRESNAGLQSHQRQRSRDSHESWSRASSLSGRPSGEGTRRTSVSSFDFERIGVNSVPLGDARKWGNYQNEARSHSRTCSADSRGDDRLSSLSEPCPVTAAPSSPTISRSDPSNDEPIPIHTQKTISLSDSGGDIPPLHPSPKIDFMSSQPCILSNVSPPKLSEVSNPAPPSLIADNILGSKPVQLQLNSLSNVHPDRSSPALMPHPPTIDSTSLSSPLPPLDMHPLELPVHRPLLPASSLSPTAGMKSEPSPQSQNKTEDISRPDANGNNATLEPTVAASDQSSFHDEPTLTHSETPKLIQGNLASPTPVEGHLSQIPSETPTSPEPLKRTVLSKGFTAEAPSSAMSSTRRHTLGQLLQLSFGSSHTLESQVNMLQKEAKLRFPINPSTHRNAPCTNISQHPIYRKTLQEHRIFGPKLLESFRERDERQAERMRRLQSQYKDFHQSWTVHRHRQDSIQARQRRQQLRHNHCSLPPPTPSDASLPRPPNGSGDNAPPPQSRSNRRGGNAASYAFGDTVRSEAEMDQVVALIKDNDARDPSVRADASHADVPDMVITSTQPSPSSPPIGNAHIDDPMAFFGPPTNVTDDWDTTEVDTFKKAFEKYPKRFKKIAASVSTRTAKECVCFYYRYKAEMGLKLSGNRSTDKNGKVKRQRKKLDAPSSTQSGGPSLLADLSRSKPKQSGSKQSTPMSPGKAVAIPLETKTKESRKLSKPTAEIRASLNLQESAPSLASRTAGSQLPPPLPSAAPASLSVVSTAPALTSMNQETKNVPTEDGPVEPPKPKKKRRQHNPNPPDGQSGSGEKTATSKSSSQSYWNVQEKTSFLELLRIHGKDWEAIAAGIPKKSAVQCKNYFQREEKALNLASLVSETTIRSRPDPIVASQVPETSPVYSTAPIHIWDNATTAPVPPLSEPVGTPRGHGMKLSNLLNDSFMPPKTTLQDWFGGEEDQSLPPVSPLPSHQHDISYNPH